MRLPTVMVQVFDYVGAILSYLVLAVVVFSGSLRDMSPSDLSAYISQVCVPLNDELSA
jgi:hypothetical protein